MTFTELLNESKKRLSMSGAENAAFDVFCLIEKHFGVNRTWYSVYGKNPVPAEKLDDFYYDLNLRTRGYPLQYILGEWDFMGLTFKVGEGVLIPRPETEILVEFVANKIKNFKEPIVYDLCGGTGCIAVSLALRFPDAKFYCVEVSQEALAYLDKNRKKHKTRNVTPVSGDIMKNAPENFRLPTPHVILSNPPYVRSGEISGLQKELQYEPRMALDGGADGLDYYRTIAEKWFPLLTPDGVGAVECGIGQSDAVKALFEKNRMKSVGILNDLSGIGRIVFGIR